MSFPSGNLIGKAREDNKPSPNGDADNVAPVQQGAAGA